LLQVRQATAALDAAKLDMAQIHQRFNSHLATNSDLLQSKANLDLAQLKLDSFAGSGATGALQQIKAQSGGIISKIDVQEGQIVPGGGPLVEIATGRRIVARLGVQPEFVGMIHKGDPVGLSEVGTTSGETVAGVAELVTKRVNSDTRLVDVFVSLPENAPLMLDGFVQGSLTVASAQGLVVPRSAVLPEDGAYSLFTVKDGRAMKHAVTMGLSDEKEAEIVGEGLKEGDVVVIEGNLELDDGMSVTVNPEATH
jgi:membrane fusion protein, multidrug efflux system